MQQPPSLSFDGAPQRPPGAFPTASALRFLRRSALLLVVAPLVGAAVAVVPAALAGPRYAAIATVFADGPPALLPDFPQPGPVGWVPSPARTVAGLASTPLVLGPVARRLGGPMSEAALASEVLAVDRDHNLVEVRVIDASPTRAAGIANAVTEQLRTALDRLQFDAGDATSASLRLTLVSPAVRPGAPTPPVAELLQGVLVGGALGLGIAALAERRRAGRHARRRPLP